MGCKAEGAAQGYTVLGGLVLLLNAIFRLYNAMMTSSFGTIEEVIEVLLAIVLIVIVVLAFDACGFVSWKVTKSGLLLTVFGFIAIVIVAYPGITLNPIAWMMSLRTLAGFMILLGGLLLLFRK